MPLTMLNFGEGAAIKRIGGKDESKRFLESLGFTVGEKVKIVSGSNGGLIVQVKDSRVAVSKGIANKIMV
jgi:ferrous iron transport protein A